MSRISFENYGLRAASKDLTYTEMAGRYPNQLKSEKDIVRDVYYKLALERNDAFLEIGCGAGNLFIPIASRVKRSVGIDHKNMIAILRKRFTNPKVELIEGNFLEAPVKGKFSKILIYSVLHYLSGGDEVFRFLDKAVSLLLPEGSLLVGDIPNIDKKARFLNSAAGKKFQKRWLATVKRSKQTKLKLPEDPDMKTFDDRIMYGMMSRYRQRGFDAYILPQPASLPFGNTREDLLIISKQ